MSAPQAPVKKNWPRYAVSPTGDRAIVDCPGDIPPEWTLETPLPGAEPRQAAVQAVNYAHNQSAAMALQDYGNNALNSVAQFTPKRGPGRPRKDAA